MPEGDEVFEAADDAQEGRQNQGVQSRQESGLNGMMIGLGTERGGEAGDVLSQR